VRRGRLAGHVPGDEVSSRVKSCCI
jgi:hypothetical protein